MILTSCGAHYRKNYSYLVGYKPTGVRTIKPGPKFTNNANPTSQPSAVLPQLEALTPEVPTSSSPASPPAMNNQENHPGSTSASGPSTPDGNKTAEVSRLDKDKAKAGGESHDLEEILADIRVSNGMPLANREHSTSMTISPENSGLLTEILDQNTVLRERYYLSPSLFVRE